MSDLFRRGSAAVMAAVIALALAGCNNNSTSSGGSSDVSSNNSTVSGGSSSDNSSETNPGSTSSNKVTLAASSKQVSESVASIRNGSILHTFAWSFKTIEESMADIAYAGYTAIQTSPINECVVGGEGGMQLFGEGKWYYHYQPTDWTIGNYQLGTKEEFTSMCKKAHEYGIKVIVDVVPNHTTSDESQVSADFINAVGGADKLYHANGHTEISDYSDRFQSTTGQMSGLPSVNTENPAFQDYFIAFLNECLACGADGFRYDTAKHIGLPDDPKDANSENNNFWERVITEINNASDVFNYGEVLQDGGERINDYQAAIGGTTASAYGGRIRASVKAANLNASDISNLMITYEDPTAVTWVESHDNYCNDGSGKEIDKKQVVLGWAIIAARANGTPLFFDRPYDSTSSNMWGTMNRIGAAGDTYYKDPYVVAVNHFRNAMVGENEVFSNPGGETSVLMIERGTKGAVLVNAGQYSMNISTDTFLPDGEYVTRVEGKDTKFTVADGIMTGTIDSGEVVVLYNEGYTELKAIPTVSVETEKFILADQAVSVTLNAKNADSSTYSINGGEAVAFSNGDKITVGENAETGSVITLTLHATNAGGETTMTYYFTVQGKRTIDIGTKIYFNKPDGWSDTVNAYVYDESTGTARQAAPWPGVPCTQEADGTYSYTFDEQWDSVLVIFNDGANQLPASMEPGWVVVPDAVYPQ